MAADIGVTFSASTHVYGVPNLEDTTDNVDDVWYVDDDLNCIQSEIVQTLKTFRRVNLNREENDENNDAEDGDDDDNDQFLCKRGIEHLFDRASFKQRQARRAAVIRAVLEEQRRQRRAALGGGGPLLLRYDDDALARASCSASEWAKAEALKIAAEDARYVRSRPLLVAHHRDEEKRTTGARSQSASSWSQEGGMSAGHDKLHVQVKLSHIIAAINLLQDDHGKRDTISEEERNKTSS